MIITDSILLLILFFQVAIKTIHFLKTIRRKKLKKWFYINQYNIVLSRSLESATAKRKQNFYTASISITLIIVAFAFYLQATLLS